jgi:hypothetical protein
MAKHHLIITGTGRAGTTLLVQLLTDLGLDTGFTNIRDHIHPYARAGMEFQYNHPNAPYILKTPAFCDVLDEWITRTGVVIDHAIVPTRNLRAAAESRRYVTQMTPPEARLGTVVIGGLWNTSDPAQQEAALLGSLRKLDLALSKHKIPSTRPEFPRFERDPRYLYDQIQRHLGGITYARFTESFARVVDSSLIHEFEDVAQQSVPGHAPASRERP